MSFQASINSTEYQVLWTKVIYSLSTISDTVRLNFNKDRVTISSINTTKTSLLSAAFNSNKFFENFTLQSNHDISILINSKPLALIFRNYRMGNGDVEFFKFTINESSNLRKVNRSRNKLFIEIMAKDNLKKSYSLNFVRCKDSFDLKVDSKYKKLFTTQLQDHHDKDRIHYLMMETSILKNFLDMFPPAIEDFKVEVMKLSRKLNLIGFNKQQLLTGLKGSSNKESQALRQPMSLTVGLSLNDILGDNFPDDVEGVQDKLNVVFRLKDFKTYINLINSINFATILPKDGNMDASISNNNQQHLQNFVELLFNNPGYPLLLSRRCELPNAYSGKQVTNTLENSNEDFELFKIELILISDSEGDNINVHEKDIVIPNLQILQNDIDTTEGDRGSPGNERLKRPHEALFVPDDNDGVDDEPVEKEKMAMATSAVASNRRKFNLLPLLKEAQSQAVGTINNQEVVPVSEVEQSVLWNDPHQLRPVVKDQTASTYVRNQTNEFVRFNHAIDKFNSRHRKPEEESNSDPDLDPDLTTQDVIGPTQGVYKVKGLFD